MVFFVSNDNGNNWTAKNTGLTNTVINTIEIKADTIFAGTKNGLFLSDDNGNSWKKAGLKDVSIYALAIKSDTIFAGTNLGVCLSTNNGYSWKKKNTGLTNSTGVPNNTVQTLAMSGNYIFAGTPGGGVFLSTNNGNNWTAINTRLTNTNVNFLSISGDSIFAGTWNSGVFRAKISDLINSTDVQENTEKTKFDFSFFPNPAGDYIEINMNSDLPNETINPEIFILNTLGENVSTQPLFATKNGNFKVDVSNLAPGMYFVKIGDKVGKFIKM